MEEEIWGHGGGDKEKFIKDALTDLKIGMEIKEKGRKLEVAQEMRIRKEKDLNEKRVKFQKITNVYTNVRDIRTKNRTGMRKKAKGKYNHSGK